MCTVCCGRNVQFKDPGYAVERLPVEQHKTYLDTSGRTVLVFRKTSLVEQHIQEFEVRSRTLFNLRAHYCTLYNSRVQYRVVQAQCITISYKVLT